MSRRLPIFFLLDCSESMVGDNLKKMEDGLNKISAHLRQDPFAVESVHIGVIAFAGVAKSLVPLIAVDSFYPPRLPLGSGTALGAAMEKLMKEIDRQVVKNTPEQKGDWRPIVFLFTDGKPTDQIEASAKRWREQYKANLVAVATGDYGDPASLLKYTDNVLHFQERLPEDYQKFIKWVSSTLLTQSQKVSNAQGDDLSLSDPASEVITLVKKNDPNKPLTDKDCVVLTGRCQKAKKPYLIKYDRDREIMPFNDEVKIKDKFKLSGCYPITEEYFEWSAQGDPNLTVNTSDLSGAPGCPHCGAVSAFAKCGCCGKLMCVNEPGQAVCPWCLSQIEFRPGGGGSKGGFDVQRGRG